MSYFRVICCALLVTSAASAQQADTVRITLAEALARAEKNAPEPRRVQAVRDQADAAVTRAVAPPPPELSVEHGFIPRGSAVSGYGERSIALDQVIPSPFSLYYRHREASASRDRIDAEALEALLQFRNAVAETYYRLAAHQRQLALTAELYDGAAFIARAAEARVAAGEASRTEFLSAAAMRDEAAMRLDRDRTLWHREMIALSVLIGQSPAEPCTIYLPADPLALPALVPDDEEIVAAAIRHSPRLRAARSALEAAEASSSLAVANLFPSFSVGIMDQRQQGMSAMYGVRFGVALPLWFALDQRSAIRGADARAAEAQAALDAALLSMRGWVRSTMEEFRAKQREYRRYEEIVLPRARELAALTEHGWREGENSFLEVIEARRYYATAAGEALDALVAGLTIWRALQTQIYTEER